MTRSHNRGYQASRDLPPYRAVLIVDIKGFSDNPSVHQSELNAEIEPLLESAFRIAKLESIWRERKFAKHTGDGYVVGLLPEHLPHLLHPLLDQLQIVLARRYQHQQVRQPMLRMRASVHLGPLMDIGASNDGVGKAMTDAHRLVDSNALRKLLDASHEAVTFLVVVVSERVYEDVVQARYTALHPSQFTEFVAKVKGFTAKAYAYVPNASGDLLKSGINPGPPENSPDSAKPPVRSDLRSQFSVGSNSGQVNQAESIEGATFTFQQHGNTQPAPIREPEDTERE